jgi:hypothetical protein
MGKRSRQYRQNHLNEGYRCASRFPGMGARLAYKSYDVGETILVPVRRMAKAFMA